MHGHLALLAAFFDAPIPGIWNIWPWLILPLCAGVALVYKTIHVEEMRQVPVEAFKTMLWILGGMAGVAAGLWIVVEFVTR